MEIKRLFSNFKFARYNITAYQKKDEDHIVLIGREVEKASKLGKPDIGRLVLVEMDSSHKIVHERIIWEPLHEGFYLEDPRAFMLPGGNIIIGLTAILKKARGYIAFPALVKISSNVSWKEKLPPVTLIETFGPGKNLTPIKSHIFLFRPDGKEYHHKLLVFSYKQMIPQKIQDLEFPEDLPWAKFKFGTTMPPIWINKRHALFLIHGVNFIDGKYIYSIGRAKLTRTNGRYSIEVAPDPIITPDTFLSEKGKPLVKELHPSFRRVVYSVGGIIKREKVDTLYLYVNVGDRATYEVSIPLNDLKKDLF